MTKARLSNLFGIRALFLPPRKKRKKKDQTLWKLEEMKPLHELSQTRMSWPRSQRVCSALSILHKGFWDRDTFPNRVGDRQKKRVGGKEKRKMLLACPLSSTQPLKTKIKHGGSVNDLELPNEMPVLKESFWCVCQRPFPPQKKTTEYFCLS